MGHEKIFFVSFLQANFFEWDEKLQNIALLILDKFDQILESTTINRNLLIGSTIKESILKGEFIFSKERNELIAEIKAFESDIDLKASGKSKYNLHKLEISSFRGVDKTKEIFFHPKVTLIYGENGTGKTTIIEALELSLTGMLFSAKQKGFQNLEEYCINEVSKKFITPLLFDGAGTKISPDSTQQFSIIEKRRIERFAELHPDFNKSSEDNTLLSALFGLDLIYNFVTVFGNDISAQLTLPDAKSNQDIYHILKEQEKEILELGKQITDDYKENLDSKIIIIDSNIQDLSSIRDGLIGEKGVLESTISGLISLMPQLKTFLRPALIKAIILTILFIVSGYYINANLLLISILCAFFIIVLLIYHYRLFNRAVSGFNLKKKKDIELNLIIKKISELNTTLEFERKNYQNLNSFKERRDKFDSDRYEKAKNKYENDEQTAKLYQEYTNCYKIFIKNLKDFTGFIIKGLTEGLESSIVEIYNDLQTRNKYKLESIIFPSQQSGKRIKGKFINGFETEVSKTMSEGNLRLLGLAILVAKALKNHSNFIIFDDIVGAIDSSRREQIATLLSRCLKDGKQIILTTHSEQFRTQILEKFPGDHALLKLNYSDDYDLNIFSHSASDLLSQSSNYCTENELKQAGRCIRDCLDLLLHKLWKNQNINLKLELQSETVNLYALFSGIQKSIKDGELFGTDDTKLELINNGVLSAFRPSSSWKQMNRSNHFEDNAEELDLGTALKQIEALKILSSLTR